VADGGAEKEARAKKKRLGGKVVVGRDKRSHRCLYKGGAAAVVDDRIARMKWTLFMLFLELCCS
jgi:hypothetical protein